MKKNIFFNLIMIFLALLIIVGSIMTVYEFSNTFEKTKMSDTLAKRVDGSNSLHRGGTGYSLKDDVGIKNEDRIMTGTSGTCDLVIKNKSTIHLCSNTEISVVNASGTDFEFVPVYGTIFVEVSKNIEEQFGITIQKAAYEVLENSVFAIEALNGTQTISVFAGSMKVYFSGKETIIHENETAILLQNEDGNSKMEFDYIRVLRLSKTVIDFLLASEADTYDDAELKNIIADREKEVEAEKAAQKAREAEILAKGGTVPVFSVTGTGKQEGNAGESPEGEIQTCTVQIRCDTILDNLHYLKNSKFEYVPENGIILDTSKVEFAAGETVFDVLKRVCIQADIPLAYEWTVEYDGYYIQSINNIAEFDCGDKSGWMYKVNGWFPNYGCSAYEVKTGDVIVWIYTCDYGKDVGDPN